MVIFAFPGGPLATVLHEVEVPILSNRACERMYRNSGHPQYIPYIFICAGYGEGGRDSCDVRMRNIFSFLIKFMCRETLEVLCQYKGVTAGLRLLELCIGGLGVRRENSQVL